MFFNRYSLPKTVCINDENYDINWRYSDILYIFQILNDVDLLEQERLVVAAEHFFVDYDAVTNKTQAIQALIEFINGGESESEKPKRKKEDKKLYDWDFDFKIIIAPINRILGYDVRQNPDVHWWTFLSAFMEIGECTFSTYVSIRDKKRRNKKLEKWEERIYTENRDAIDLPVKHDETTEAMIHDILGY